MEEVARRESKPLTAMDVKSQVDLIQEVMKSVMKDKEHYGLTPGCGDKPALLKPGAEKLNLTFRMAPDPETEIIDMGRGHREYRVKCVLRSIETSLFLGAGIGSASTMETKWRFRKAEQKCPKCGKEAIIKGKQEYGGGWLCFKKKGGCGEKFKDGDPIIENQEMGRVEYDNPADYYNTCWKMAKKRSLVDAVLTVTAASDIFTQDIEEMVENGAIPEKKEPQKKKEEEPELQPGSQRIKTVVLKVESKEKESEVVNREGQKEKKISKWFLIHTEGEGVYRTFSETFKGTAEEAKAKMLFAEIDYTVGKYGNEIQSIRIVPDEIDKGQ